MYPRILIVHARYQQRGGEDAVVDAELELLRNNGHEVELYEKDNKTIHSLPPIQLAIDTVWSRKSKIEISQLIKKFRPDIIHIHNTFPIISPSIYWASNDYQIPIIQTLHNFRLICPQAMLLRNGRICEDCLGHIPWRSVIHKCYRNSSLQSGVITGMLSLHRIIKTYDKNVSSYIALTDFAKNIFVGCGIMADRIFVKPNFVNIPRNESNSRTHGLYVGRLSQEKGLSCLASAIKRQLDTKVIVIGDGPMSDDLKAIHQFELLGWQNPDRVYEFMRSASYLIVPSIWYETFGLIIIEAFACGLPVIASDIGAMAELVKDCKTGLLFKAGSPESLANKLAWANDHPEELKRMGNNARREYEKYYTPLSNYKQLVDIYLKTLDNFSKN